jgi:hypothetical protein
MSTTEQQGFRAQSHAWFADATNRAMRGAAWEKLGKLLLPAMKRWPQTDTRAQKARLSQSAERLQRLLAQVLAWQDDLADGLVDGERDDLLVRIEKILVPSSPAVIAQRSIILGIKHARRHGGSVDWVRQRTGGLAGVDDETIAKAIAGTPRADASILTLLAAAGVPLTGKNPERMIRKYGYGN